MSIQDSLLKFKAFATSPESYYGVLLICIALAAFGLGRLSGLTQVSTSNIASAGIERFDAHPKIETVSTETESTESQDGASEPAVSSAKTYVASKNGTKYHLPWCSGAQRMKEENKVWFETKEEAEAQGYAPAANCKGI